jgi:sarcosine oxidase delta subunit
MTHNSTVSCPFCAELQWIGTKARGGADAERGTDSDEQFTVHGALLEGWARSGIPIRRTDRIDPE